MRLLFLLALILLEQVQVQSAQALVLDIARKATTHTQRAMFPIQNSLWSYHVTLGIGTPPRPFRFIFDTGSALTWITSTACRMDTCTDTAGYFDPWQSSTSVSSANRFDITYGSGQANGSLVRDTLRFSNRFAVPHQSIGLASYVTRQLTLDGASGILGFAPSDSSHEFNTKAERLLTPMESLVAQNLIAKNMFSVYFEPYDTVEHEKAPNGRLTLGDLPSPGDYQGEIQWSPRVQIGRHAKYWAVPTQSIRCGDETIELDGSGLVDTGTTLIVVAAQVATVLYNQIGGALYNERLGVWTLPCDVVPTLPTLTFQLENGVKLVLTPQEYLVPSWQSPSWGNGDSSLCLSYVVGADMGDDVAVIFGQKFLENIVSVFDADHDRIGFAPRARK